MNMSNLDYNILKVNGKDANDLSNNDAVKVFLNQYDPILIEIQRKCNAFDKNINNQSNINSDSSEVDDDLTRIFNSLCLTIQETGNVEKDERCEKKTILNQAILRLIPKNEKTHTITTIATQTDLSFNHDKALSDGKNLIEHHNVFKQCFVPELYIEEIILNKSSSNERLGLSLCYSTCNGTNGFSANNNTSRNTNELNISEKCIEVFIGNIQPNSLAFRDGRLRQGDQILQINGKDLKNKQETELFISESGSDVALLVSRYIYRTEDEQFFDDLEDLEENNDDDVDEDENDDEVDEFYEEKHFPYENCIIANNYINATTDVVLKNMIEQSVNLNNETCLNLDENKSHKINLNKDDATLERTDHILSSNHHIVKMNLTGDYDTEHIYETIPEDTESEPLYCSPYESTSNNILEPTNGTASALKMTLTAPCDFHSSQQKHRVAQWLGIKDKLDLIKVENNSLKNLETNKLNSLLPHNSNNIAITITPVDDQDNSSSAYNTGGSNNSVSPVTLILQPHNLKANNEKDTLRMQSPKEKLTTAKYEAKNFNTTELYPKEFQHQTHGNVANMLRPTANISQNTSIESTENLILNSTITQCPQFTAPNLSKYHFVSSQQVCGSHLLAKTTIPIQKNTKEDTMVWKVKRRPDGSRYIVRRPLRNRILRERSLDFKIEQTDVRSKNDIFTTEEETIYQLKTGRNWSREQRKKHIERSRDKKQQEIQKQLYLSSTTMFLPKQYKQQQQQIDSRLMINSIQKRTSLQQQNKMNTCNSIIGDIQLDDSLPMLLDSKKGIVLHTSNNTNVVPISNGINDSALVNKGNQIVLNLPDIN